jgi:hypothetical protein
MFVGNNLSFVHDHTSFNESGSDSPVGAHVFGMAIDCDADQPLIADTFVRMEGCTIADTNMPGLVRQTYPHITTNFFHDMAQVESYTVASPGICVPTYMSDLTPYKALTLAQVPDHAGFPSMRSQWMLEIQQVLLSLLLL